MTSSRPFDAVRTANQAFREGRAAEALDQFRRLVLAQPAQREALRAPIAACLQRLGNASAQQLLLQLPDPAFDTDATRYQGRELLGTRVSLPPVLLELRQVELRGLRLQGVGALQMQLLGTPDWVKLGDIAADAEQAVFNLPEGQEVLALRLLDAALPPNDAPALAAVQLHYGAAPPVARRSEPSGVAAGVASCRGREAGLKAAVESLAHQVDELHVFLNDYAEVPAWLKALPHATIYRSQDHDELGDAGKFFGFSRSRLPYYLSFDDDILYPPGYVGKLKYACDKHDAPCGLHARLIRQPNQGYYRRFDGTVLHFRNALASDRRVHILGTGTLMIPRARLPRLPVFDFRNMADIWFAHHCAELGVPLFTVARRAAWLRDAPHEGPSIFDRHRHGESDQRLIVDALVQQTGRLLQPMKSRRPKLLVGLRSYQRVRQLSQCLYQLQQTACDERFDIVLAIADDGSNANAQQWLEELQPPYELHLLRHQQRFGSGQTNALLQLGLDIAADFIVIADDNLQFRRKGWMSAYFDAAMTSGYHHLCAGSGEAQRHADWPLQAYGAVTQRPALFTATPALLRAVGFVEENLRARPEALLDFTLRSCRAGFNEAQRLFDIAEAERFIMLPAPVQQAHDPGGAPDAKPQPFEPSLLGSRERLRVDLPKRASEALAPPLVGFDAVWVVHTARAGERGAAALALRKAGVAHEFIVELTADDAVLRDEHETYLRDWSAPQGPPPTGQPAADLPGEQWRLAQAAPAGPPLAEPAAWAALRNWQRLLRVAWRQGAERLLLIHEDADGLADLLSRLPAAMDELPRNWRLLQLQAPCETGPGYGQRWQLARVVGGLRLVGLHREAIPLLLDSLARESLPFERGAWPRALQRFAELSFSLRRDG